MATEETDLSELSRDDLNDRAEEAGVETPEDLPNKQAVIDAINEAEGTTDTSTSDTGDGEAPLQTSDAAAHVEGVTAGEVEPDTGDGPHSSDAAAYPFPTAGDVDVATIPEGRATGDEWQEPLTGGNVWVKLGTTDNVPEENHGAIATVVDSATYETDDGTLAWDESEPITVKVRDASSATLQVDADDIIEISRDGRSNLVPFA